MGVLFRKPFIQLWGFLLRKVPLPLFGVPFLKDTFMGSLLPITRECCLFKVILLLIWFNV